MRSKPRKPFIWLIIMLCSAALLGLFFTPALADESAATTPYDVEMDEDSVILDDFEGADLLPEGEESFGQGFQSTWIPSADFSPMDSLVAYNRGPFGAGLKCKTGGISSWFDAGVRLPSGARLQLIRIFFDDSSGSQFVRFWLYRLAVSESNGVPYSIIQVGPFLTSPAGVQRWGNVAGTFNHTIANRLNAYQAVFYSGDSGACFAGARLFWNRQIRTGLPNPFVDISSFPAVFQDSIKALAASGITTGTTPNTYSPNNNVTRAQMAVFLARALGLYWDYGSGY